MRFPVKTVTNGGLPEGMAEPIHVSGCSFVNGKSWGDPILLNDEPMHVLVEHVWGVPVQGCDGNVFWPTGWTEDMRREWRRIHFCNGHEWSFNDGRR